MKGYTEYSVEELEMTRESLWDSDYLPILFEFLELKNGMRVLDAGCGTGFFSRLISSQIKGEIVGIDLNQELLEAAKKITKEEGLDVKYSLQDVYNMKFEDNYFDLSTCHMLLSNLSNPQKALKEMKRVTRNGGLGAAIEPCNCASIQYFGEDPDLREVIDILLKVKKGREKEMENLGSDLSIGMKLPSMFYRLGLSDIDVKGYLTINFGEKFSEKRKEFEFSKLKEASQKYITYEEFQKILNITNSKKSPGAIQALPLFMVKGVKYEV